MARRSAESGFAGRDRRFADEVFAFEKIRVLLGNADDDLRRSGNAVAVPIAHWRRSGRDRWRRRVFGATGEKGQGGQGTESSNECPASHLDAQSNTSRSGFNAKDLWNSCGNQTDPRRLRSCSVRFLLAQNLAS